jgi:hypothetical protein
MISQILGYYYQQDNCKRSEMFFQYNRLYKLSYENLQEEFFARKLTNLYLPTKFYKYIDYLLKVKDFIKR